MTQPIAPLDGPPRERFGPYIVQEKIGAGGMATVYRALHVNGQNPIALKVLAIHLAGHEDVRRRFEREARTLIQFDHPHILPVFDFGEEQGTPYIVLKLLSGRSLDDLLAHAPLPFHQIARLTRQIASALDYAHARGIVHRDIKPANILLDDQNNPYLADFGVAYLTESDPGARLTQAGSFVGTVAYASPEQCRNEPLNRPSDVYSLAVAVFQMATGQLPFAGPSSLAIMKQHMHDPPPNPIALNPDLPIALYHVLVKALHKLPENRFPSAMKFSEAVDAAFGLHIIPAANDTGADSDAWLHGDLTPVSPDNDPVIHHTPDHYDELAQSSPIMPAFEVKHTYTDYADQDDPFTMSGVEDVAAGFANADFDDPFAADISDDFADFAGTPFENTDEDQYPSVASVLAAAAKTVHSQHQHAPPQPPTIRPIAPQPQPAPDDPRPIPTRSASGHALAYTIIVIALVIIVGGGLIALRELSDSTDQIALDATNTNPAFGITFDYPAGWTIREGDTALLSTDPTGTIYLSDHPILPGANYGAATLTLAIQRIDPADIYEIPSTCTFQIVIGPSGTFTCMAAQGYLTPTFSAFHSPYSTGGVILPGTLPPTRASFPMILLPVPNEPTWIAIMIVHWVEFADAREMLDRVARSIHAARE
ncbi:MAG: serine/threonine protein kinase [Anaerolineae bacterium]|nr:serine/threonine protein kinase [Anaerolineae bacterium]